MHSVLLYSRQGVQETIFPVMSGKLEQSNKPKEHLKKKNFIKNFIHLKKILINAAVEASHVEPGLNQFMINPMADD